MKALTPLLNVHDAARSVMKSLHALIVGLCLVGTALADEPAFRAHTPPAGPLRAIGPETPEWPNRLSIEYEGRATIRAKYRFVYDEENGFEQNPSFGTLFVEVKNEVSAPSVAARGTSGC